MSETAILDFRNSQNFIAWRVLEGQDALPCQFRQNWSEFLNFAAILDFRNSQVLLADGVQRAEMHHCAKFYQNPSIKCKVIANFRFQDGGRRYLQFHKFSNFISQWCPEGPDASPCQILLICQSVVELLQFFNFSRWRPSAILDSFETYLNNPQKALGLYHYAKFGCNRCRSLGNMHFSHVWLENAYSPSPKIGVCGGRIWPVKWRAISTNYQKGTSLRESSWFEPSSAKICPSVWPVGEFPK